MQLQRITETTGFMITLSMDNALELSKWFDLDEWNHLPNSQIVKNIPNWLMEIRREVFAIQHG